MRFGVIISGLMLVVLSACSTNPKLQNPEQNKSAWSEHKNSLGTVQNWQFSGRFGAKTDTENWNGSISWSQHRQQYKISISGPLSSGSVLLEGSDEFSTLTLSNEQLFVDSDPQALLQTHTGLKLPVRELRYWLLGLPAPSSQYQVLEVDENGQLSQLTQNNWEIKFKRYTSVDGKTLPNKIFMANHEINVRLIIQKWQILS